MQEIQRFTTDDGNTHRFVISTEGGKEGVRLETAATTNPDHWIPRQHWYFVNGNVQTIAGGHVIVSSNGAEYIYRPMTMDVEVRDQIDDTEDRLIAFKEQFSDAFKQSDSEMVHSLLCYFPVEDGLPDQSDVAEWLSGWLDKDRDSVRVQCWSEKALFYMSSLYRRQA